MQGLRGGGLAAPAIRILSIATRQRHFSVAGNLEPVTWCQMELEAERVGRANLEAMPRSLLKAEDPESRLGKAGACLTSRTCPEGRFYLILVNYAHFR